MKSRRNVKRSVFVVAFCWISGLVCLVVMLSNLIYHLYHLNMHYSPHQPPHWESQDHYNYFYLTGTNYSAYLFSKFSYQVDLVAIMLLLAGPFLPWRQFWYLVVTGVASYMGVMTILFNSVVLTLKLQTASAPLSRWDWVTIIWLHAIFPVCFWVYALFFYAPRIKVNTKRFFTHQLGWLIIYPLAYCGIIILRGELILTFLKRTDTDFHWINLEGQNRDEVFNYFFFNLSGHRLGLPNWGWMILLCMIGSLIWLVMVLILVRGHNLLVKIRNAKTKIKRTIS